MQPVDLQLIGKELAIKWPDGLESFIPVEQLRRACPCAGCQGETDILGHLHKNPTQPLTAAAFELVRMSRVGGYALQPLWGDGHQTGLYSFDSLRRLAGSPSPACPLGQAGGDSRTVSDQPTVSGTNPPSHLVKSISRE